MRIGFVESDSPIECIFNTNHTALRKWSESGSYFVASQLSDRFHMFRFTKNFFVDAAATSFVGVQMNSGSIA